MNQKTHVGIYGLIIKNNAIILIRKSRGPYTGTLDLPGGRAEFGKTPYETLVREVQEETGIQVLKAHILAALSIIVEYTSHDQPTTMHHTAILYKITGYNDTLLNNTITLEDSAGATWNPIATLKKNMLSKMAYAALNSENIL